MNKNHVKYINQLKKDKTIAPMIENNIEVGYIIEILHRGEELFYYDTKKEKAIIVDIQIRNNSIFQKSILVWDTLEKISEEERKIIIARLINYFHKYQNKDAIVI